jgi:hypothetical protein
MKDLTEDRLPYFIVDHENLSGRAAARSTFVERDPDRLPMRTGLTSRGRL